MATWLKQSTATTIVVGPLVDSAAAAPQTGLTISQSEVLLWKQGGSGFSAKNESTAATHRSYGMYTVPLDATDTNTLGQLIVGVYESGILVARNDYMVVPANVWDSMFGSDKLQVDAVELNSVAASAANLERSASVIVRGTVTNSGHSPTTTAFKASDITEATNDHFIGRVVVFTSGNLLRQATVITDYDGATSVYTVSALTEAPVNGDTFVIV
jgi:hypothetical protein